MSDSNVAPVVWVSCPKCSLLRVQGWSCFTNNCADYVEAAPSSPQVWQDVSTRIAQTLADRGDKQALSDYAYILRAHAALMERALGYQDQVIDLQKKVIAVGESLQRYVFDEQEHKKADEQKKYHAQIMAVEPTGGKCNHDLYIEALDLVSERHDKYDLVDLVNWLLHERAALERSVTGLTTYKTEFHAVATQASTLAAAAQMSVDTLLEAASRCPVCGGAALDADKLVEGRPDEANCHKCFRARDLVHLFRKVLKNDSKLGSQKSDRRDQGKQQAT